MGENRGNPFLHMPIWPPISTPGSAPALSRLGRGKPVPMPHPLGASILAPSELRPRAPPRSLVPPADLELVTCLSCRRSTVPLFSRFVQSFRHFAAMLVHSSMRWLKENQKMVGCCWNYVVCFSSRCIAWLGLNL